MLTNTTFKGKITGIALAVLTTTAPSLSTLFAFSHSANANTFCQCVAYVANSLGIGLPANAKDTGPILERNGFSRVSIPQSGDIVVMQPTFSGADTTNGHVGKVEVVSVRSGRTYISVRGTNQNIKYGYSVPNEASCSNVSVVSFGAAVDGNPNIAFYRRVNNNTVFVLWSSSIPLKAYAGAGTSFRVTRDVATNSPLYFSARANGEGVIDSFRRSSQPNTLWYKLNGVNEWMSAAQVLDLRTVAVFVLWSPSSPLKAYAGPGTNFPVTRNVAANSPLYFSAWAYGEPLPSQSGSDARWYKLNGANEWIPGAHVIGIAPGTTPMP